MKTFLQRSVAQHDTAAWLSGLITSIAMQMQPTTSVVAFHSVQVQIWIKGSYLDQRLSQHESFYPIGPKSARIEIPLRSYHIDFSKTDIY